MEPVPETRGYLPWARGWFLGLMRVRALNGRHHGGEKLWQPQAGGHTEAEGGLEGQEESVECPHGPYRIPRSTLCSSGKNLSWGHDTENPLCRTSAMWQGENLDSVVVLLREHGQAWAVGRRGQQNWPWALGIIRSKDSPGRAPSPQHSLGQPGPKGRGKK